MTGRLSDHFRAAWWALRALRRARAALRRDALRPVALPPPPAGGTARVVDATLAIARPSCLERATVRQAWLASRGIRRDVVIGVTAPRDFAAHAWLEGDPPAAGAGFAELLRRPPA